VVSQVYYSPNFGRDEFVKRPKGKPCPSLVWFLIESASNKDEWPFELLRTIARSPTPFQLKNPALKEALKALGLEWLKPSQISRIRECPAPERKVPRHPYDRWFSRYGESKSRSPKCKELFWAWRHDQKTCDLHSGYASMFRVQKHRKRKQKERQNLRQLKDARQELKRARRERRRDKRQAEKLAQAAARLLTPSQLQAQNDRADLQLLKLIRLGYEPEATDSERLEAMIRNGYVVPDPEEPQAHRLTGQGWDRLKVFRQSVGRGPALT